MLVGGMLLLRGKGRRRGSNTIWSYLVQVREIHHYLVLLMYGVHFCVSHLILILFFIFIIIIKRMFWYVLPSLGQVTLPNTQQQQQEQ